MRKCVRWILVGSVLFLLVTPGCGNSPWHGKLQALSSFDTAGTIPITEAIGIALEYLGGGFAIEAELEIEDDDENEPPAYEVVVYLQAESMLMEVEVHAKTGQVLEVEVAEEGDHEDDND